MGIDDMFALVTNLENLTEEEVLLPLEEKMGLVLLAITSIQAPVVASSR